MLWILINIVLSVYASYIIYTLSLSFLNINLQIKRSFIPVFFFGFFIFISKIVFHFSPVLHTILLMILCAALISTYNKLNFIFSITASLLTMTVIIIGSLLIVCPLLNKFNINLEIVKYEGLNWLILNIGELLIPTFVLLINKLKFISIINLIAKE